MRTGRADREAGGRARHRATYPSRLPARPPGRLRLALCTARTRARVGVFVAVFVVANLAGMSAAFGDGEGNSGGSSVWRWMDVDDSRGNSAWGYSMSLDYGGLTDVGNAVFGGVTGLCWFFYQWFVIASIWLINFALSMDWFNPLREPAAEIADGLQVLLAQAGLVPVLLTITAVVAGMLIMRGAWATAVFEVIVALVVLALGTGVFANPVDETVGATGSSDQVVDSADNSGWLAQATGAGLELAGGLQQQYGRSDGPAEGFSDAEVVREDISGQLVDTFLRTPHQLINYGKVLDNTECEGAYNRSLNTTPPPQPSYVTGDPSSDDGVTVHAAKVPEEGSPGWPDWNEYREWLAKGNPDDIDLINQQVARGEPFDWDGDMNAVESDTLTDKEPREIVADCDEAAGERAENPSPGMAGDAATMGFGVVFLVGLAALLAFTLIFLGVEFLWCALRSIWDFVLGLLPGRSRHTLWQTLSTAVWCLVGVAFTSIFLVTYLLVLNEVATSVGGESVMGAFALVDILMLVGLILFWRLRQRMKSAAARTAALLAKRPNPNPNGKPPGWIGQPAKMPAASNGAAMPGGLAATGRRGLKAGKATALGAAAASTSGAAGIAKSAQVGGALASGGALLGIGIPYAASRVVKRRFGASAENAETNGAVAANGTQPAGAQAHGSREAFSDERGVQSRYRRPGHIGLVNRLHDAQAPTAPQPGGPEAQGPYRRVRKNGQTLLVPENPPDRARPTTRHATTNGASASSGRARATGIASRWSTVKRVRTLSAAELSAGAATAGVATNAAAPVMSGPGQYVAGVAVGGIGAVAAIRAVRQERKEG